MKMTDGLSVRRAGKCLLNTDWLRSSVPVMCRGRDHISRIKSFDKLVGLFALDRDGVPFRGALNFLLGDISPSSSFCYS
jgi:hypothetical protein